MDESCVFHANIYMIIKSIYDTKCYNNHILLWLTIYYKKCCTRIPDIYRNQDKLSDYSLFCMITFLNRWNVTSQIRDILGYIPDILSS